MEPETKALRKALLKQLPDATELDIAMITFYYYGYMFEQTLEYIQTKMMIAQALHSKSNWRKLYDTCDNLCGTIWNFIHR